FRSPAVTLAVEAAHVVQRAQQIALAGWVAGALQAPGDLAVCGEHGIEQAAILLREPVIVPVQILAEVVDEDAERGLLPRGQGGFGRLKVWSSPSAGAAPR